jgi:23S rRNA (guanosine2251-2'-O)-methyltransferase
MSLAKGAETANSSHEVRCRHGSKRGRGRRGAADDCWVWGIHSVREMVEHSPAGVEAMCVVSGRTRPGLADLIASALAAGIEVRECEPAQLNALAQGGTHQGVAARMGAFAYTEFDAIVSARSELIIALDCVQDPRNLGAILRTAQAVDAGGVVLPKDRAAAVTAAVLRGAAGHVYRVPIARVTNLARAIEVLKGQGWWALGLLPDGDQELYKVALPERILLVIGGEGGGIRPLVARICDERVSLPMAQGVNSLNAAVAAGVALYEIRRRHGPKSTTAGAARA